MSLEVIDLNNELRWDRYERLLTNLQGGHPFYKRAFLETFFDNTEPSLLKAFVFKDRNGSPLIIMPFLHRKLKENHKRSIKYYDVISPYGYSGPYFREGMDRTILKEFWTTVDRWYQKNNVISEFIRFDVNFNHNHYSGTLVKSLEVVKGKLIDLELIWKNYKPSVRKNIKKAIRENLEVSIFYREIPNRVFEEFYAIYIQTMDRKSSNRMFYFSKQKLEQYFKQCEQNIAVAVVYNDEIAISVELVLLSETIVFSFLGGTNSEYFKLRPNNLLKHTIIEWACENKFSYYVLGGGHKNNDGIYKYKKAFFKNDIVTFYTGRKIVNNTVYYEYCLNTNDDLQEITEGFFPRYREGLV